MSRLCRVNTYTPTAMCSIMTRQGSDKGAGWHNYTTVYSDLFQQSLNKPLVIFELGLGTKNPDFMFNMGAAGSPGASLRGWRRIFPRAKIYGADIDRSVLFEEDRIQTFYCDQLDVEAIRTLWSQPALEQGADIIIDDGLHTFEANDCFLQNSLSYLKPGGTYVVEDVSKEALEQWRVQAQNVYSQRFPDHIFALVLLPNSKNDFDNNLVLVRRRGDS